MLFKKIYKTEYIRKDRTARISAAGGNMGYQKAFGYCRRCRRKVLISCPAPSHLLHFLLSLLSAGLWIPVWIAIIISDTYRCRCCLCQRKVHRIKNPSLPGPSLSRPWPNMHFRPGEKNIPYNFNTVLIKSGLVWYASSRTETCRHTY